MASNVFNFNRYDLGSSDEFSFSENKQESSFVGSGEIKEDGEVEVDPEQLIEEEEIYNIFGSETEGDDKKEFEGFGVPIFQWVSACETSGQSFDFTPGSATGPQIQFNPEDISEKVVFELFFMEELFSFLADMTNMCAAKKQTDYVNKKLNWVDTDKNEIRVFVGLLIAMGTVTQPNYIHDTGILRRQLGELTVSEK